MTCERQPKPATIERRFEKNIDRIKARIAQELQRISVSFEEFRKKCGRKGKICWHQPELESAGRLIISDIEIYKHEAGGICCSFTVETSIDSEESKPYKCVSYVKDFLIKEDFRTLEDYFNLKETRDQFKEALA